MSDNSKYYTTEELAELFKVNYRTIIREIERGNLDAFTVGHQFRISQEALDNYTKTKKKG